ncbi:MAG: 16S rRNA (uracil1498-N3)-methyltransferase [Sphingobacteriales bacterium]|jgi:16S rRNA (uracil1498-N3)-methyltransferase
MRSFYQENINSPICELSEEESKHLVKVLRMTNGDFVEMLNGMGGKYEAQLIDAHPKRCKLEITKHQEIAKEWGFKLEIAIAPTKNPSRMEYFVEKAVELGIDCIHFLSTENSERSGIKMDRLERIAISAMKQSKKYHKPIIQKTVTFTDFLEQSESKNLFIAHCNAGEKLSLKSAININEDVCILIGPEGDFTKEEVDLALKHKAKPITLGKARLRTETAAIFSVAAVQLINQQ